MQQAPQKPRSIQVQVKATDDVLKGFYSNAMNVSHTKEEFFLDFVNLLGQAGVLGSRIITSPSHLKRIAGALNGALRKYEQQFGTISEGEVQDKGEMGFNIKPNS
jgi:hypothetical protein